MRREVAADEITRRLVLRMATWAFHRVEAGVARCEADLDVALVLGTGLPGFRGGVLQYAGELGPDGVWVRLERLAEQFGERFSPCRLLREMGGVD